MALITCKECGEDVSSRAGACPNCGMKIKGGNVGCFTITAVLFLAVVGFSVVTDKELSPAEIAANKDRSENFIFKSNGIALITSQLKDAESARFENVRVAKNKEGVKALCGTVNSKNGFGAYTGFTRFVGGENRVEFEGSSEIFNQLWVTFCK